ncbi:MAG: hypothetical protein J7L23_02790 [Candidatus Diapherotrites archaeon]|nr:hypothetical protein [Candidatus Diapherotrites archaeon]
MDGKHILSIVLIIIALALVIGTFLLQYKSFNDSNNFGREMAEGSTPKSIKTWCSFHNISLTNFDHIPTSARDAASWVDVEFNGKKVSPCKYLMTDSSDIFQPAEVERMEDFCRVKGTVEKPEMALFVNDSYCVFVEHS